jgi:GNAT superfamily N-acetyltransferase
VVSELVVRPAVSSEVDRIVPMYEWLFAPPGAPPPRWDPGLAAQALRRAVASDSAVVLVAVLLGEFVGICTAYEDMESVRYGRRVWVEDLAIDPTQRSAGIGKRLLDEAKQWAQARGATHLELDSAETRTDAHRFYERERPTWRSVCFGWELDDR